MSRFLYKVDNGLASRVLSEPNFNHIRIATSLYGIEFDEYTQKDVTLRIQPNYIKKAGKISSTFSVFFTHTKL